VRTCVSNRDTDPPIQKLLHAVGMLCINYYEACQRKNRANSWNDCHSRVEVSRQQAQKKGFRARASRISSLASGRGGPRYCGGQQSGLKKRLSSSTRPCMPPPPTPTPCGSSCRRGTFTQAQQSKACSRSGSRWDRTTHACAGAPPQANRAPPGCRCGCCSCCNCHHRH
jgi:hypothetical protein